MLSEIKKPAKPLSEMELWGSSLSDEAKVKVEHPSACIWGGHHGKVWVADGEGNMLSGVCYLGTREQRRALAWKQAAEGLVRAQ